ncbi:hypothetical protein BH23ACT6_BH23ACT6_12780 [soil metagenome]
MRRSIIAVLAAPMLFLTACGTDDDPSVEEATAAETSEEATEEPTDETEQTSEKPTEETTDESETTEEPADESEATEEPAGEAEGGKEGEAAAAVTKEFMVELANAEPRSCDSMLDAFHGSTEPMSASEESLTLCQSTIVPTLEGQITEEQGQIIELIEVNGADVQGDTATVDKDNFSELFAEGFGDESIQLKKVDDEWYVDLENSFQGATGG